MNENALTQKILKHMNAVPRCFARKRHGGKFGSGDPDIAGVIEGLAFFCEVKLESGTLTKLQAVMLDKWKSAGAETSLAIYDPIKKNLRVVTRLLDTYWIAAEGPVKGMPGGLPVELTPDGIQIWLDDIRSAGGLYEHR